MKVNSGRSAVQGALALVLALILPFASPAQSGGEIRNYIISINHLYENLDYELALSRIQLARQLPRSTDDEVTLSLYEGIILYELRKQGPATSVFRSALLLRPDAKVPVQVAPKVEALLESVRTQVKKEMKALLPPSGTEKPPNKAEPKAEPKREGPPSPPSTGPAMEKREDTRIAQSPKKEEPLIVEPKASAAQVARADTKLPPMPPAPTTQKAEQKKDGPVAVQPIKPPDCTPEPSLPGRNLKERQVSRLALMKQTLCLNGQFQGPVSERWRELRTRLENAATSHERTLIAKDIDQFDREFIHKDPEREKKERLAAEQRKAEQLQAEQRKAERLAAEQQEKQRKAEQQKAEQLQAEQRKAERLAAEQQEKQQKAEQQKAEQLEAEQRKAERLATEQRKAKQREAEQSEAERTQQKKNARDDANLYASKCQPIVSADCELLMRRLLSIQGAFLRTNPPSKLVPIRQLVTIGQEIRAARSTEELKEAAHALDLWRQRQLPQ